jgi:hypothetical protein
MGGDADSVMALWDRIRRRRREGMYADLIDRSDPRVVRYTREVTRLSSVDAPGGITLVGPVMQDDGIGTGAEEE